MPTVPGIWNASVPFRLLNDNVGFKVQGSGVSILNRQSHAPVGLKIVNPSGLLHMTEAGVEDAPVVFLHGMASSGQLFGLRFGSLGARHNLLFPDLLGFGYSPRPSDSSYDPIEHVLALRQTLQAKAPGQLAEGFTFVAHSMGGLIALAYAARFPQEVRRLILFNPLVYWSPEEARENMSKASVTARMILRYPKAAQTACLSLCSTGFLSHVGPHLVRSLPPDVVASLGRHSWASLSRTIHNLIINYDLQGYVAEIKANSLPVTIITGQYDRFSNPKQLGRLQTYLPSAQIQHLAFGHHPFYRQTALCLELLETELSKVNRV